MIKIVTCFSVCEDTVCVIEYSTVRPVREIVIMCRIGSNKLFLLLTAYMFPSSVCYVRDLNFLLTIIYLVKEKKKSKP